jgi:hypothetical protein
MPRTSLKLINPDIPSASPLKRWKDSCHFTATLDINALVAISMDAADKMKVVNLS